MMDFGHDPTAFVVADVDATQHALFAAFSDVLAMPESLDGNLDAAAVTATTAALEARNIPAGWVTTALTYRQVCRAVMGMFQFAQKYAAVNGGLNIFRSGITLSTRWNQLAIDEQARLTNATTSIGYSTASFVGVTTLRAILKSLSDQWGDAPFYLGGLTI